MDFSEYFTDNQEDKKNKTTPGTVGQTILQNVTKAGVSVADLISRLGGALNPYLNNPVQEKLRQERSKEMGYAIAGLEELDKEKGMPDGIPKKIVQAASQMAVDIPAKYANPAWAGVMIGEGALGGLQKGQTAQDVANRIAQGESADMPVDKRSALETLKDVATGGGKGALDAVALKTLGAVSKLAPKGIARPLIEGAGFGGMAAAPALVGKDVDIQDVISQAIIGGFFGFRGKDAPQKKLGDFKAYIKSTLGRDLKPAEHKVVAEKFKAEMEGPGPTVSAKPEIATPKDTQAVEIAPPGATLLDFSAMKTEKFGGKQKPTDIAVENANPEQISSPHGEGAASNEAQTRGVRHVTFRKRGPVDDALDIDPGSVGKSPLQGGEFKAEIKIGDNGLYTGEIKETSGIQGDVAEKKLADHLAELNSGRTADMAAPKPEAAIAEPTVPSQAPPPTSTPYEPKFKPSGPAVEELKVAVKKELADPDSQYNLPQFETAEGQGFAERSVDFVTANPKAALDVLNGSPMPAGTNMGTMFVAMKHYADKSGDRDLMRQFVESKGAAKLSEAGSVLGTMGKYKDENSPTGAIADIESTRKKVTKEIKDNPLIAKVEENRFMKTWSELNEAMKQHEKGIDDARVIWERKKINQYAKKLGKKELDLNERIKAGDFTKDPQYKTWLDQQTKGQKEKVKRLQMAFDKMKEIRDRRKTGMSDGEIDNIIKLSDRVSQTQKDLDAGRDRMAYGRAWVDFHEYVNELKFRATKPTIREALLTPIKTGSKVAGFTKAIKASFDNSYIFRQGFKAMWSHPGIWAKNSIKSFEWAVKQFGGKHVMRELMADIVSRPNYVNGTMNRMKISFGNPEEPFPTSVPEKIWFFGKLYKASETAFAGQAYKTRADLADKFIDLAGKSGIDIKEKKQAESIGKLVNSLTGRGDIGHWGKGKAEFVNNVFFSARFFKSNLDFLTAHQFQKGVTPFVRKQAAMNLLKATLGTAAVLGTANALKDDSVDFDTRSASFGKIKVGNTRFDVTGGMGSIITLASRLISGSSKSSTSGRVTELNTGKYGAPTGKDIIQDFVDGKLSPFASVFWNGVLGGRDRLTRGKPTITSTFKNLTYPMPVQNLEELLKDPNSADVLLSMIADGLGIGVNTYGGKVEVKEKEPRIDFTQYFNK